MCEKNNTYRHLIIKQFPQWRLELSCNQVYLGKVLIILNRHLNDLTEISDSEQEELFRIMKQTRAMLNRLFHPDKFNYASLGNADSHVHLHIVPRYQSERVFAGQKFMDTNWGSNYSPYNKSFLVSDSVINNLISAMRKELE